MPPRAILTTGSALAGALALGALATPAGAQERYSLTFDDHRVGRTVSAPRPVEGRGVTLDIRRTGIRFSARDWSEICAVFKNESGSNWSGRYALTGGDGNSMHDFMSVPAYGTHTRCEQLAPQLQYHVILQRD